MRRRLPLGERDGGIGHVGTRTAPEGVVEPARKPVVGPAGARSTHCRRVPPAAAAQRRARPADTAGRRSRRSARPGRPQVLHRIGDRMAWRISFRRRHRRRPLGEQAATTSRNRPPGAGRQCRRLFGDHGERRLGRPRVATTSIAQASVSSSWTNASTGYAPSRRIRAAGDSIRSYSTIRSRSGAPCPRRHQRSRDERESGIRITRRLYQRGRQPALLPAWTKSDRSCRHLCGTRRRPDQTGHPPRRVRSPRHEGRPTGPPVSRFLRIGTAAKPRRRSALSPPVEPLTMAGSGSAGARHQRL